MGDGLVGYAALHKEAVLVPDVSVDPRYIKVVDDARSELVIPLMLKDRCIGVFDLESPELDAFTKSDVEILTLLASQAAVAIENARLYETIRANEVRLEKEIRFAQRVQAALLPTELPKRMKGVDVAARFAPARELGGDLYDFLAPEPNSLVRRGRRRVGQGRAGGALQRVCRRAGAIADVPPALRAGALQPGRRAGVDEHDPPRAAARGVLLHALLRAVRLQAAHRDAGQLRPAVSGPLQRRHGVAQIELPGVPLGSFAGSTYDEVSFDLDGGRRLSCSARDGVFEANDARGREFGAERLLEVVASNRARCPRARSSTRSSPPSHEFRGDTRAERRHDGGGDQDQFVGLVGRVGQVGLVGRVGQVGRVGRVGRWAGSGLSLHAQS